MRKSLPLVFLLCIGSMGLFGCPGQPEDPMSDESSEPKDSTSDESTEFVEAAGKIKPGRPVDLPPGLRKMFAGYASHFFVETQGDRAVFAVELQNRLKASEVLFIVDVRDEASYQRGHIPAATNIPIEGLFTEQVLETLPTDGTPVVVICANGHVSSMAAGVLGTMGYNAYALRFGMIGWNRATPVQVYSTKQVPQTISGLGGPIAQ